MNETGALQEVVESRGLILILSPKCHSELTGCGIEYSWGKSKQYLRRAANDTIDTNLPSNLNRTEHGSVKNSEYCTDASNYIYKILLKILPRN